MKTSYYNKRKEEARDEAIQYQNAEFYEPGELLPTWGEIAEAANYFTQLGRRYGLLLEFRENGII